MNSDNNFNSLKSLLKQKYESASKGKFKNQDGKAELKQEGFKFKKLSSLLNQKVK